MLIEQFNLLINRLSGELRNFYGTRLASAVIFGSIGRNTPNHDSDVDLLN
ncbi:MAG: nucleotidyltransferase domain-containing protein [bacterium]